VSLEDWIVLWLATEHVNKKWIPPTQNYSKKSKVSTSPIGKPWLILWKLRPAEHTMAYMPMSWIHTQDKTLQLFLFSGVLLFLSQSQLFPTSQTFGCNSWYPFMQFANIIVSSNYPCWLYPLSVFDSRMLPWGSQFPSSSFK
jgi:hypothetical protein